MPYVTGRILILIVTATIRLVVIATTLAGIAGARAVHAQGTTTPSWGDVYRTRFPGHTFVLCRLA